MNVHTYNRLPTVSLNQIVSRALACTKHLPKVQHNEFEPKTMWLQTKLLSNTTVPAPI